jgi:type IV pilus assembly protein PilA
MNNTQGFTLIELMIVVAIIAILAAIALPAYQDYTIRAQVSECAMLNSVVKTNITEVRQSTGVFPATNVAAGLPPAATIFGKYISQVAVTAGGVLECTYSSTAPQRANALIDGKVLTFTPTSNVGSVSWTCDSSGAGAMPQRYLPTICRTGSN